MNTKICPGWSPHAPFSWRRERARGVTSIGRVLRKGSIFSLRRGLLVAVTAATLTGGCGDGSSTEGSPQATAGEQGSSAIVAGSFGFRCRPHDKRVGACGHGGGASGSGGAAGGKATGGAGGGVGGSGAVGSGGAGGLAGAGGQLVGSSPFTILASVVGPVAVTTEGTNVAWLEATAVRTCPITGCGATTPAPINAAPITDPVVDAMSLDQGSAYWLSGSLIQRCPLTGCADNETFATLPPSAIGYWSDVAVHAGIVYAETRTSVYQCPVGGCAQTPTAIFGRPDDWGTPFAVDDTGIFISITGEGYGTYYCAFGGCPPTIGAPLSTPGGSRLAAVNGTVFMWDQQGNITSCPSTGCPGGPTSLATGQTTLTSLGADASGVYWTTSDGTTGSVFKCALPACAGGPSTLATDQANPVSLNVSEHYLVWANNGGAATPGSIMGLAK